MRIGSVIAGVPNQNMALYHRIRFAAGDPAGVLLILEGDRVTRASLVIRDIEVHRASEKAAVDEVFHPAQLVDAGSLSVDREVATAQALRALAERHDLVELRVDRSVPLVYADVLAGGRFAVHCELHRSAAARRQKSAEELESLRAAQAVTERAVARACETVADCSTTSDGRLISGGEVLTAERLQAMLDVWLLEEGYAGSDSIVACGPRAADCHDRGSGPLVTGQTVVLDVFPRSKETRYYGDCTRTVVHGEVPERIAEMHAAVSAAKLAAIAVTRAGVTGEQVHLAAAGEIAAAGFAMGGFEENDPADSAKMTHGTGHGVGLDLHEPPLLVPGGPALVVGDVVTIEPGLYARGLGGVRIEDMVAVTAAGHDNFNTLHEGLDWRTS